MGTERVTFDVGGRRPGGPLIIVHLMKTGGFSLGYQLTSNVAPSASWGPPADHTDPIARMKRYSSVEELQALGVDARSRLEVVKGHLPFAIVDLEGFEGATVATLLRDPVDRVVSYLKMCKATNIEHRDLPLEEIYEDEFFGPRTIRNHQTKMLGMSWAQATTPPPGPHVPVDPEYVEALAAAGAFRTAQFVWTLVDTPLVWPVEVDGSTLERAVRNLERVDVLGIYDEYDDFITRLGKRAGWHVDLSIRANRSALAVEVEPSFRRRIEEGDAFDIELYERARALVRSA